MWLLSKYMGFVLGGGGGYFNGSHPIEQNIQALNDGEHNLKLHAPCSIIRCVPCLVQCIGTAIQGSFTGDSTGCDVMGLYSAFATYSSQMATLLIAYLTYRIMFSTVPKWEYVALVGLAIFVLSGLISMLPLIGVASYVKYDGFCYIDYQDVTHCVLWLLIMVPCVFGDLPLYVQIYKRSGLSKTVCFCLLGFWFLFFCGWVLGSPVYTYDAPVVYPTYSGPLPTPAYTQVY